MKKYSIRLVVAGVLLAMFIVIAVLTLTGVLSGLENLAFRAADSIRSEPLTNVAVFFAQLGWWWMIFITLLLLVVLPWTRRNLAVPMGLSFGIGAVVTAALKAAVNRPRPSGHGSVFGSSFPSGHTMNMTTFFIAGVILLFMLLREHKWVIPFIVIGILLPVGISLSRIYTNAHFLGDVLGGWTLGTAIALLTTVLWQVLAVYTSKFKKIEWLHRFVFPKEYWRTQNQTPPDDAKDDNV